MQVGKRGETLKDAEYRNVDFVLLIIYSRKLFVFQVDSLRYHNQL